ncbi:MAG: hypothetical protein Q9201_003167 [Fulgogasparrea decipioides]
MPDALSKTIPMWCAVMNRLLFEGDAQNIGLCTPETVVSPSEHSQIESRLSVFTDEAKVLQLDLPFLRQTLLKPLRPFFLTPDLPFPTLPSYCSHHPIICLTSSHRVYGAENSENGYIQGAGDDSEGWSHGLRPALLWENKEALMKANEVDLPKLIRSLLQTESLDTGSSAILVKPTECIYIGPLASARPDEWDAIIVCNHINPFPNTYPSTAIATTNANIKSKILHLPCHAGKRGSRALRNLLHLIPPFVSSLHDSQQPKSTRILFACPTGKDLSTGAALVALCLFFNDDGGFEDSGGDKAGINKSFIRRRLTWITTSIPQANPSRETLQAVNSFLMKP